MQFSPVPAYFSCGWEKSPICLMIYLQHVSDIIYHMINLVLYLTSYQFLCQGFTRQSRKGKLRIFNVFCKQECLWCFQALNCTCNDLLAGSLVCVQLNEKHFHFHCRDFEGNFPWSEKNTVNKVGFWCQTPVYNP